MVLVDIRSLIYVLEVGYDIVLDMLWQLDGPHRLLHHVQLFVKNVLFLVDSRHQSSHVSENVSRHDGTDEHNQCCEEGLGEVPWGTLISHDHKYGLVNTDEVLEDLAMFKEFCLLSIKIFGWDPVLSIVVD